ncbi:MAG TPA: hypothetical protein VFC78_12200, partial [Tepidisphaeraceae bacterium]|nr:hypothetical protein [Tepidisphaeraceae bacterium]
MQVGRKSAKAQAVVSKWQSVSINGPRTRKLAIRQAASAAIEKLEARQLLSASIQGPGLLALGVDGMQANIYAGTWKGVASASTQSSTSSGVSSHLRRAALSPA